MITRRLFLSLPLTAPAVLPVASQSFALERSDMLNLVLLGDSVFDNGAYVTPGQEVISQVRQRLPAASSATLLARDGAVSEEVRQQFALLPPEATHLVISAGGNDALRNISILAEQSRSVADALLRLAEIRQAFADRYRAMLDLVSSARLPTTLCTIYDAQLPDAGQRTAGNTALTAFNDIILREATSRGYPVLDLRVLFSSPDDYANPIEPSSQGGRKIAQAIMKIVLEHDFDGPAGLYA